VKTAASGADSFVWRHENTVFALLREDWLIFLVPVDNLELHPLASYLRGDIDVDNSVNNNFKKSQ